MIKLNFNQAEFENLVYQFAYLVSKGWRRKYVALTDLPENHRDFHLYPQFDDTEYAWFKEGLTIETNVREKYDRYYMEEIEVPFFSLSQALSHEGYYDE